MGYQQPRLTNCYFFPPWAYTGILIVSTVIHWCFICMFFVFVYILIRLSLSPVGHSEGIRPSICLLHTISCLCYKYNNHNQSLIIFCAGRFTSLGLRPWSNSIIEQIGYNVFGLSMCFSLKLTDYCNYQ